MGEKNTIELNGKIYDTLTGKPSHYSKSTASKVAKMKDNIDGFVNRRVQPNRRVNTRSAHKPERAKTLMRRSVKKPRFKSKSAAVNQSSVRTITSEPIAARTAIKERRLINSRQVFKSHLVNRFSSRGNISVIPITKIEKAKTVPGGQTLPKNAAYKSTNTYSTHSAKDVILAAGLAKATSHKEKFPIKPKKRSKAKSNSINNFGILVFALIVLTIVGWVLYQNRAHIELRIVDTRSGVNAELPSYLPAGFKAKIPIQYSSNSVTITFSDNNSDFTITQKNSDWDSQTLRDSYVVPDATTYQTYQNKGRTIYIFGLDKASWVNQGIWYQINGNTKLTTTQLMDITNSM